MKTEEVKILIQAFYRGETTVKEEQKLLYYFEGNDIPAELSEEKKIFLRFYQSEPVKVPENLESKLNVLIDQLAGEETKRSFSKTKKMSIWISSVAACIIILITSGIILNMQTGKNSDLSGLQKGIITDPDVAAIEAQKALVLVSRNFNKGTEQLALVSENIEKANQLLEKQLKTINNHEKKNEN